MSEHDDETITKVVINTCYGGFGLSEQAMLRYAELKGLKIYPEGSSLFKTYWTVPENERPPKPENFTVSDPVRGYIRNPNYNHEQTCSYNEFYNKNTIYDHNIPRTDLDLVRVVEELGNAASGPCAELTIEELPKGTFYRIKEYDGLESIETNDDVDWLVA